MGEAQEEASRDSTLVAKFLLEKRVAAISLVPLTIRSQSLGMFGSIWMKVVDLTRSMF